MKEKKLRNWEIVTIDTIGEIVTGTTPRKSESENFGGNYPFFKPPDIEQGYFLESANDTLTEIGIAKAIPHAAEFCALSKS